MKLAASLLVRNELGRYLAECVGHLLEFCDVIVAYDDGSEDGTAEWLREQRDRHPDQLALVQGLSSTFYQHEGATRQTLLEATLAVEPTHVLAIDADEFVADGAAVRAACARPGDVHTLEMEEVWELDGDCICVREDGGWRSHPVPALWRVPERLDPTWRIADRALACGREPQAVRRMLGRARPAGTEILHFGWANQHDRAARHARYAEADGGRFHASRHLDSILWPPDRVELRGREWPAALGPRRAALAARVAKCG